MKNHSLRNLLIALVLFVLATMLTELPPFGARAVALVNGGYGTFDMKTYGAQVYLQVMESTTDFSAYIKYYVCDFMFIAAFLNLMVCAVRMFSGTGIAFMAGRYVALGFAVARGLLDAVENGMLLYLIYGYPASDAHLADICNILTRIKFLCMRLWFVCFLVLLAMQLTCRFLHLGKKN